MVTKDNKYKMRKWLGTYENSRNFDVYWDKWCGWTIGILDQHCVNGWTSFDISERELKLMTDLLNKVKSGKGVEDTSYRDKNNRD